MRWHYAFIFCFSLVLVLAGAGLPWQHPHFSVQAFLDGTIYRPFAYRVVAPVMMHGLLAVGLPVISAVVTLFAGALLLFTIALRWLARGLGVSLSPAQLTLAMIGLLPLMLRMTHLYDPLTLALWTAAIGAIVHKRQALYFAIFTVACLNRETTILLSIIYALQFGLTRLTLAQVGIYGLLRVFLLALFADRPGYTIEFHLAEHWQSVTTNIEATMLYLIVFGAVIALVAYRFAGKPWLLRASASILVPVLVAAFIISGYPFEFRVFYEVYPIVFLLALPIAWPSPSKETGSTTSRFKRERQPCVLCGQPSTTTAVGIPVCNDHWREYWHEARYWQTYRPFLEKLRRAHQ